MVYERVGNETRNHKTTESHAFIYVMSRKASDITGRLRLFNFVKQAFYVGYMDKKTNRCLRTIWEMMW